MKQCKIFVFLVRVLIKSGGVCYLKMTNSTLGASGHVREFCVPASRKETY